MDMCDVASYTTYVLLCSSRGVQLCMPVVFATGALVCFADKAS